LCLSLCSLASTIDQSIRAVSEIVRVGDIQAVPFELSSESKLNEKVMVETIRSPEKLLVVVVNINANGYSNALCHTGITDRHWTFRDHEVNSITLKPQDTVGAKTLTNWQEVVDGTIGPMSDVSISGSSGSVVLSGIKLAEKIPVRFFVADVTAA
jgi:hypothetical protein